MELKEGNMLSFSSLCQNNMIFLRKIVTEEEMHNDKNLPLPKGVG